ncbi:MAG: M15 family metallopeptidase [Ruminiclostridium sp.]|nr:M15 family metallopeptidase [Ruminiclostridium sp.]
MAKKRKRNRIAALFKSLTITCILLVLFACFVDDIFHPADSAQEDWNLLVVNQWNELPKAYSVDLMELSNGERIDSRIYPSLQKMFDDARAEGVYPIVRDGYRTAEEQQELMDEKIQAYVNEGYSRADAKKAAEDWVAIPGTSEHQLGSAVDINADKAKCSNEEVYAWLAENAHEYGFILRYPQGKEDLTGISYEPWHYRYVGIEVAQAIYQQGVCLEEYVLS